MRTLVGSLLNDLAPFTEDSGVCVERPDGKAKVIQYLNLACESLQNRIDDSGTLWKWQVQVCQRIFGLPEECLEARQMWINGATATQYDSWYEGKVAYNCGCTNNCYGPGVVDLGTFTTPAPFPNIFPIRPAFVAQSDGDAGVQIEVELVDEYQKSVRETVTLLPNQQPAPCVNAATDLSFLQKPLTKGAIELWLMFDNGQRIRWAPYSRLTRIGAYRRKRLGNWCPSGCTLATIKGKRRRTPITSEDDICPFDCIEGLQWAVAAIAARFRRNADEENQLLAKALNGIYRQMQDGDSASNLAQARFRTGWGCNPSQAANRPLPGTSLSWGWGGGMGVGLPLGGGCR